MTNSALDRLQPVQHTAASFAGTAGNQATQAGLLIDGCPAANAGKPTLAQKLVSASAAVSDEPPPMSCNQKVWISIFFDGTGNNMRADLPTLEHSNVARMFRAHPPDDAAKSIYRRYVPGIGTLFPEKGDAGKGPIPKVDTHNGMGSVGQARLDYAFEEMQKIIAKVEARAMNPTNKIVMINVAVFGFSRGATLARAFVRDLLDPKLGKTILQGNDAFWKSGHHPMEVRFMGLWDTVASVGLPMSANNVKAVRSSRRRKSNVAREVIQGEKTATLRAVDLAFGKPGADPAPGPFDGHGAWADGLAISPVVKQCVHMIAAHEIRNSFPVDSVLRGRSKPANCKEFVYPGAHSNVGGGYRPGENGKGGASRTGALNLDADKQLSLVPLRAMYDEARAAGVPLLVQGGRGWNQENTDDFALSPHLAGLFNYYLTKTTRSGVPLGTALLVHSRMYFAWRWWRIAQGRKAQADQIAGNDRVFNQDRQALERQKVSLQRRYSALQTQYVADQQSSDHLAARQWQTSRPDPKALQTERAPYQRRMAAARTEMTQLEAEIKEIDARLDTMPSEDGLMEGLDEYDQELVDDARSILAAIRAEPTRRAQLRPHYKNLIETFEEHLEGRGLNDMRIQDFFDNHVHDSLAGFAKDSTLPSDPRVVYVGGDAKLEYARAGESAEKTQALTA